MGKGTGKRKVRASARHAYSFPRSWQRRGHREGPALPGRAFTAQAAAAPLFPGPRGRAWRGWLAPERLRRELSQPSVYSERRPDLQAGACARRVSRVPGGSGVARGGGGLGGRHASGCGVGELGSACARPGTPGSAGPFRRFPPDSRASDGGAERRAASPGAPCTRRAPLRPSAAWHLADAPWRGGGGPAVWEPRGPPPPAPRPAPARCLRPRPSRPAPSPARRSRSPARR